MAYLIARVLLIAMIALGLRGAGNLSFEQYQTGEACPVLGNFIPACYIAFGGYILIAIGAVLSFFPAGADGVSAMKSWGRYLFWAGTAGGELPWRAVWRHWRPSWNWSKVVAFVQWAPPRSRCAISRWRLVS